MMSSPSSSQFSEKILILGIESSCDETAVAIISAPAMLKKNKSHDREETEQVELLSSVISTQIPLHRQYGGVVPELASRNHSYMLPQVIRQACQEASVTAADIDYFAATAGPGLASSLLVGNTTAKALAFAAGKPYIAVNHLEGHLLSPFLLEAENIPAHLGLVVSGGHTLFIDVQGFGEYNLLGRSLDDAAGEAFDKVGKMLGLPYPGGPEIEKAARGGNPQAFAFPRAMIKEAHANVSFSGLKTAVLYTLPQCTPQRDGNPDNLSEDDLKNICASFQEAVIDVLMRKLRFCLKVTGHRMIAVSGGVACNGALRMALGQLCAELGISLHLSPPSLSTDNAAMIAYIAWHKALKGHIHPLGEEVNPNLPLTDALNRTKGIL